VPARACVDAAQKRGKGESRRAAAVPRYSRRMADGPDDKRNPYNEEESARRRGAAGRHTPSAAAARDDDRPAKRPSRGPEKYRGVEYSVTKHGEGSWIWKLRAPGENGAPAPTGTVRGRQNDAIEAAHRAIDKQLGTGRK
jgi:hypothetical protein